MVRGRGLQRVPKMASQLGGKGAGEMRGSGRQTGPREAVVDVQWRG